MDENFGLKFLTGMRFADGRSTFDVRRQPLRIACGFVGHRSKDVLTWWRNDVVTQGVKRLTCAVSSLDGARECIRNVTGRRDRGSRDLTVCHSTENCRMCRRESIQSDRRLPPLRTSTSQDAELRRLRWVQWVSFCRRGRHVASLESLQSTHRAPKRSPSIFRLRRARLFQHLASGCIRLEVADRRRKEAHGAPLRQTTRDRHRRHCIRSQHGVRHWRGFGKRVSKQQRTATERFFWHQMNGAERGSGGVRACSSDKSRYRSVLASVTII